MYTFLKPSMYWKTFYFYYPIFGGENQRYEKCGEPDVHTVGLMLGAAQVQGDQARGLHEQSS